MIDHLVHIFFGYAEGNVVLCGVAVNYGIYLEEPEHPPGVSIRV
jgi:hypothetical protein